MEFKTVVLLILAIGIIARFVFATCMTNAAINKGHGDEAHPWVICFLLGVLGGLYVIALPDKTLLEQNEKIIKLLQKKNIEE